MEASSILALTRITSVFGLREDKSTKKIFNLKAKKVMKFAKLLESKFERRWMRREIKEALFVIITPFT